MSDMVPEVLNAALDSLFTPKEPGEQEYQGVDGLLYCRNCHTPVQCRVKLWGRDKIVPCLCRCQQEAMAEKKRQDELVERQRKIRQLKATGIQEKHLLEWNFGVAEDNKDIQMAKRYVEQWKKVKAENLGLLLWGDVGTGKSFVAALSSTAAICSPQQLHTNTSFLIISSYFFIEASPVFPIMIFVDKVYYTKIRFIRHRQYFPSA